MHKTTNTKLKLVIMFEMFRAIIKCIKHIKIKKGTLVLWV
jgi:hypothetical protein